MNTKPLIVEGDIEIRNIQCISRSENHAAFVISLNEDKWTVEFRYSGFCCPEDHKNYDGLYLQYIGDMESKRTGVFWNLKGLDFMLADVSKTEVFVSFFRETPSKSETVYVNRQ